MLKYSSGADLCLRDTGLGDEIVVETKGEQADHLCQEENRKESILEPARKTSMYSTGSKRTEREGRTPRND